MSLVCTPLTWSPLVPPSSSSPPPLLPCLPPTAGIPITLSLVYMEVARRCGVPMTGVNLPAHFMIRPALPGVEVLVDAFHGGEVCYLEDAAQRLSSITGYQVGGG